MLYKRAAEEQKQRRKTKERKTRLQQSRQHADQMLKRLKETGLGDRAVIRAPAGTTKMSEVLLAFVEPYRQLVETEEMMRRLLLAAQVAWNTALQPEEARQKELEEIAEALPPDSVEDFYAVVEAMIERKLKYFAAYTRPILDYELTDTGTEYHISVVSMDPEGEQ